LNWSQVQMEAAFSQRSRRRIHRRRDACASRYRSLKEIFTLVTCIYILLKSMFFSSLLLNRIIFQPWTDVMILKILSPKKLSNKLGGFFTQNTAKLFKNWITTLVFQKYTIFAEN
jgi:hypothetical protein